MVTGMGRRPGARRNVSRRPVTNQPYCREKGSSMLNRKSTTTNGYDYETDTATSTATASRSSVTARQVTHVHIARRAYEIFKSGTGGTPEDNWFRAERELRARA